MMNYIYIASVSEAAKYFIYLVQFTRLSDSDWRHSLVCERFGAHTCAKFCSENKSATEPIFTATTEPIFTANTDEKVHIKSLKSYKITCLLSSPVNHNWFSLLKHVCFHCKNSYHGNKIHTHFSPNRRIIILVYILLEGVHMARQSGI